MTGTAQVDPEVAQEIETAEVAADETVEPAIEAEADADATPPPPPATPSTDHHRTERAPRQWQSLPLK